MKSTAIDAWPVSDGRRNYCSSDEGIPGVGEVGISKRELAIIGAIDHFRPLMLGMDPFRTK
ncbi:MAG: hypothetical protein OXF32_06540 [Anaerolineaceae bacterium]|nr:hypothetical protein [Anaerolineaceae bacterium]